MKNRSTTETSSFETSSSSDGRLQWLKIASKRFITYVIVEGQLGRHKGLVPALSCVGTSDIYLPCVLILMLCTYTRIGDPEKSR